MSNWADCQESEPNPPNWHDTIESFNFIIAPEGGKMKEPEIESWIRECALEIGREQPWDNNISYHLEKIIARHYAPEAVKIQRLVKAIFTYLANEDAKIPTDLWESEEIYKKLRAALKDMKK